MRNDDALRGLSQWLTGFDPVRERAERIAELAAELRALRVLQAEDKAKLKATCPTNLDDLEYRFWTKVDIVDDDDSCWPFLGGLRPVEGEEYGIFRLDGNGRDEGGRTIGAHRMAFVLTNGGLIPDQTRHTCDNPPCCRPKHLLDGTHADNMRDRSERGRYGGWTKKDQRGEANDSAVLTDAIVIEARKRSKAGETQKAIADSLGVPVAVLGYAIRGKTWTHLDSIEAPHVRPRGGGSHLVEDDIRTIRKRAAAGDKHADIAADYGMDRANISHIVNRKSWKHVTD